MSAEYQITPRHYQQVDAKTAALPGTRAIHTAVEALKDGGGLLCVSGKPGVGKTYGTEVALRLSDYPVHWADMSGNPLGKEAVGRIYQAVMGRREAPKITEYLLIDDTVEALSECRAIVVIDEAHGMTLPALRQLRFLFDRPTTNSLFVLIGADLHEKVAKVPELDSRVTWRVSVDHLASIDSIAFARKFHSTFDNTHLDVLAQLEKTAKGYPRIWAKILFQAQVLKVKPKKGISKVEAAAILKNLGVNS